MRKRTTPPPAFDEALGYSVKDVCRVGGWGITTTYKLIKEGKLKTVKVASRTIVTASSLRALIEGEAA